MAHTDNSITRPVGVNDVQAVLGTNSADIFTLCTHPDIDIWSRFKPIRVLDPRTVLTEGRNYRGADGQCGIEVPRYTDLAQIVALNIWPDYKHLSAPAKQPTGPNGELFGYGYPACLGHFDGYRHDAKCPIANFQMAENIVENYQFACDLISGLATSEVVDINGTEPAPPGSLKLNEIAVPDSAGTVRPLSRWYFGVVLSGFGGSLSQRDLLYAQTASHPGVYSFNGSVRDILDKDRTVRATPFLSDKPVSFNYLGASLDGITLNPPRTYAGAFVLPPNCGHQDVKLNPSTGTGGGSTPGEIAGEVVIAVTGKERRTVLVGGALGAFQGIDYAVSITSHGLTGFTMTEGTLQLKNAVTGAVIPSVQIAFGRQTVAAGSRWSSSGFIARDPAAGISETGTYMLVFTVNREIVKTCTVLKKSSV